ncbi:MAG: DUF5667 domain-containing protein [Candidatus Hydrothermarchaeales archaeon]
MKGKISTYIAILLVLFGMPMTAAQDAPVAELPDPGTTPDSFLYFLDLALDNLALALTFNDDAKIEKSLEIAEERLSEARTMALEGKIEAMSKAEGEHGKTMQKIRAEVEEISDSDSEGELKKELEIERKIKEHSEKIEDVGKELEVKIKIEGEITPEQEDLIVSILNSLEGQTGEVEIEIKNEKGKTKIKIEQETGKSGDDVEDELEDELGITEEEREDALEEIAEVREDLEELLTEAEEAGVTLPEGLVGQIEDLLGQAQDAFDAGNFEEAEDLAEEADDLLDDVEDQVEDLIEEAEEELEIEVEITNDTAEVEVEDGEAEDKFVLNMTDREEIISAIAERRNLTVGEVRDVIEFEEE